VADLVRLAAVYERMPPEDRGPYFRNLVIQFVSRGNAEAEKLIHRIFDIWIREAEQLPPGKDLDRPDPGLLKALGYSVARDGPSDSVRQLLLTFALSSPVLPPVKDRGYMAEWGEPNTIKRYSKLRRVLNFFIEDHSFDPRMQSAIARWNDDLDFLARQVADGRLKVGN
jgi:hypothetical protein